MSTGLVLAIVAGASVLVILAALVIALAVNARN